MRLLITVSPAGHAWQVRAPSSEPALFRSGGQAEACARRLATRLAHAGRSVEIEIHLRDGRLAGRLQYMPARELEPA
jgi:hypothetical protein